MERVLASIREVSDIVPIEGADFIEEAIVGGWHVIVKKGEFTPGSQGVFFEIDSVLDPELPWVKEHASFMEARSWRIRTMKMRGVLSQGLLLPMDILPEVPESTDCTELLGVKKYEIPETVGDLTSRSAGPFPSYIVSKTDEIRVQSVMEVLDELWGKPYYITEKADGSSATYLMIDGKFTACSRNLMLREESDFYRVGVEQNIKGFLEENPHLVVQGEFIGPGVQGNKYKLKAHSLKVFNIFDTGPREYLHYNSIVDFSQHYGFDIVRLMASGKSFGFSLEELLVMAKGKYPGTNNDMEGIVVRSLENIYSPTLRGRLSFKVLNNNALLKEK